MALAGAAAASVLLADASQMSKAEVERIWLPFVPWLLLSCALLPERWRTRGLSARLSSPWPSSTCSSPVGEAQPEAPAARSGAVANSVDPVTGETAAVKPSSARHVGERRPHGVRRRRGSRRSPPGGGPTRVPFATSAATSAIVTGVPEQTL